MSGGCRESVDPAPPTPVVIQSLLIAGRDSQFVWVERATPPESIISASLGPRPVDPADLNLTLAGPTGAPWVLGPSQVPGRLVTASMAAPSTSYELRGTVQGLPILATCHVPGAVTISPGGTVFLAPGDSVVLHWNRVADAALFGTTVSSIGFSNLPFHPSYRPDTSVTIRRDPSSHFTFTFYVMAVDAAAASFLPAASNSASRVRGNITGALGMCGGASVDSVAVIAQ
jgi:hypothetical protein